MRKRESDDEGGVIETRANGKSRHTARRRNTSHRSSYPKQRRASVSMNSRHQSVVGRSSLLMCCASNDPSLGIIKPIADVLYPARMMLGKLQSTPLPLKSSTMPCTVYDTSMPGSRRFARLHHHSSALTYASICTISLLYDVECC